MNFVITPNGVRKRCEGAQNGRQLPAVHGRREQWQEQGRKAKDEHPAGGRIQQQQHQQKTQRSWLLHDDELPKTMGNEREMQEHRKVGPPCAPMRIALAVVAG